MSEGQEEESSFSPAKSRGGTSVMASAEKPIFETSEIIRRAILVHATRIARLYCHSHSYPTDRPSLPPVDVTVEKYRQVKTYFTGLTMRPTDYEQHFVR
jgi:hypothetical protein